MKLKIRLAVVLLAVMGGMAFGDTPDRTGIEPTVLTKACIDGVAGACANAPMPMVELGDKKSLAADEKLCRDEKADKWARGKACLRVGYAYETGTIFRANAKKAEEYLRLAAPMQAKATEIFGRKSLLNASDPKRLGRARGSYINACQQGNPGACQVSFDLQLMSVDKINEYDLSDQADRGCRGGDMLLCQRVLELGDPGGLPFSPRNLGGHDFALRAVCDADAASPRCGQLAARDTVLALGSEMSNAFHACRGGDPAKRAAMCARAVELAWINPIAGKRTNDMAFGAWEAWCLSGEPKACGDLVAELDADRDRYNTMIPAYIRTSRAGCALGEARSCTAIVRQLKTNLGNGAAYQYATGLCRQGSAPACAEARTFPAEAKDPKHWSWQSIDPTLPMAQRYMLAARHLQDGDRDDAVRMLRALVAEGDPNATYLMGVLLINGLDDHVTRDEASGVRLLTKAADASHPRAAYNLALYRTRHRLADKSEFDLMRIAIRAGVPGAQEWWEAQNEAIRQNNAAIMAQRQQSFDQMNQMNRRAQGQMDRQTIERAWTQMFDHTKDAQGERVCALIYEGQRTYQDCMSKEAFDKHYTPLGGN